MKILPSFTLPHVILNLHAFLSSAVYKRTNYILNIAYCRQEVYKDCRVSEQQSLNVHVCIVMILLNL